MMLLDHPCRDQSVANRHRIGDIQRAITVDVSNFILVKKILRAAKTMRTSRYLRPARNLILNLLEQFAHKN
jgi:hypothetical protein